jgi:hypothetical protein
LDEHTANVERAALIGGAAAKIIQTADKSGTSGVIDCL